MFERFTDRARRVVVLAQEEARMLNHNYIGTEHILLGLIHEGEGVAAKALESLGISLEAVRQQVEEIIGQGQQAPSGHIPFTPRAKKVLELSLREALQLGHNYIGTEHILLGLIREGEGVAAQVLVKLGADLNRVRQQVIQLLHGYQGQQPAAGTPAGITAGGFPAVVPYLLYADAGAAMDWLVTTFGFTAAARDTRTDGTVRHGELRVDGGGVIMLGSAGADFRGPRELGGVTQLVRITVAGLKAHRDRTKAAGAVASEIQECPAGWQSYSVHDPEGHEWYFTQFTGESG